MKSLYATIALLIALSGFQAMAEELKLKPQTQGNIQFISGGIGEHEQQAIRAMQGDYNLHLLFSVKSTGEYVSGAKVKILSHDGKTLLDTVSAGPNLLVKMEPGHYTLIADRDGHIIEEAIMVPKKHGTIVALTWAKEKGD
jgi:hypothetical protein